MSDDYGIFSCTAGDLGDFGSSGTYGDTDAPDTTTYLFRDTPVGGSWNPSRVDGQPTSIRTLELSELATLPEHQQHMVIKTSNPAGLGMNLSRGGQQSAREEFTHGGQSYYKENGQTYMVNPEAIGGVDVLHPERAAEIERQRAEEKERKPEQKSGTSELDPELDWWSRPHEDNTRPATEQELEAVRNNDAQLWPSWLAANVVPQAGIGLIAGGAAGAGGGVLSGAYSAFLNGIPQRFRDAAAEAQRQKGMPIPEKMSPIELDQYYGPN